MSLINTIALPLFAFFVGLAIVIFVVSLVYRGVVEARTRSLLAKRNARLDQQKDRFITALVVANDTLDVSLTPELSEELMKVYYQIDAQKELSR